MPTRSEQRRHRRRSIELRRRSLCYAPSTLQGYTDKRGRAVKTAVVPTVLDIYSAKYTEPTLRFLNALAAFRQSKSQVLRLDFRSVREIKAAALVMLFATLDRLITEHEKVVELFNSSASDTDDRKRISALLETSGIAALCAKGFVENPFDKPQMPVIQGLGGDYRDEIIDFISQKVYKRMSPDLEFCYSDAVYEAINNVAAHAYLNKSDATPKKWWLMCEVFGDQLFLVIYDSGIGIPASIDLGLDEAEEVESEVSQAAYTKHLERVLAGLPDDTLQQYEALQNDPGFASLTIYDKIRGLDDGSKIKAAMTGNITRRVGKDELKHGQGSKSIRELVSSNDEGVLWVCSGFGKLRFIRKSPLPNVFNLTEKLQGTLIQWNIKVVHQ